MSLSQHIHTYFCFAIGVIACAGARVEGLFKPSFFRIIIPLSFALDRAIF